MQKIIILDTETTGTAQLDRICQLSYIVLDSDGKITEYIIYSLKDLRNAVAHNNIILIQDL